MYSFRWSRIILSGIGLLMYPITSVNSIEEFDNNNSLCYTESNVCKEFGSDPILIPFNVTGTTISDKRADLGFKSYWNSNDLIHQFSNRLNFNSTINLDSLPIRYLHSMTCATLKRCHETGKPICQQDCEVFWESFLPLVDNKKYCPDATTCRSQIYDQINQCQAAPFNGQSGTCASADLNEPGFCGFSYDKHERTCQFCASEQGRDASCCQNILAQCDTTNYTMVIVMIVMASIILILVLVSLWRLHPHGMTQFRNKLYHYFIKLRLKSKSRSTKISPLYSTKSRTITTTTSLYSPTFLRPPTMYPDPLTPTSEMILDDDVDNNQYFAKYSYLPVLEDEILLKIGDRIIITDQFDDGWAFGHNLSSQSHGAFPLMCIIPADHPHPHPYLPPPPTTSSTLLPSLNPPTLRRSSSLALLPPSPYRHHSYQPLPRPLSSSPYHPHLPPHNPTSPPTAYHRFYH